MKQEYKGQSYKWDAFTIEAPDNFKVGRADVELRKDGNMTYIEVIPSETGEPLAILPVSYSGEITESSAATGKSLMAFANSGSWSGGGNYSGVILGRLGARVIFNRKGTREYFHFVDETKGWEATEPIKEALPVEKF